jgi:hypothetical protein
MTKSGDYGIATLALDGTQIKAPLDDTTTGSGSRLRLARAGAHQLAAGRHTVTLTVTGKKRRIGRLAGRAPS